MNMQGKKYRAATEKRGQQVPVHARDGFSKVKELAYAKFDESVDVHVNLGIDIEKTDQGVRGSVVLPHGRGRSVKIIVFAKGDYADQALKAGADEVGLTDLIEKIEGGWLDFTYAVATPDVMGQVGRLAKILGPRGLLPNKKVGTVTFDVAQIVSELKSGKLFFKSDKAGLVHFAVGRVSFSPEQLIENYTVFLKALVGARPATAKGKFIKKITVCSTMGVGVQLLTDDAVGVV